LHPHRILQHALRRRDGVNGLATDQKAGDLGLSRREVEQGFQQVWSRRLVLVDLRYEKQRGSAGEELASRAPQRQQVGNHWRMSRVPRNGKRSARPPA
jgi:hypothetical protein